MKNLAMQPITAITFNISLLLYINYVGFTACAIIQDSLVKPQAVDVARSNIKHWRQMNLNDQPYISFVPGYPAPRLSFPTLNGEFDLSIEPENSSFILAALMENSGFTQCLFNDRTSFQNFAKQFPKDTHFIFLTDNEDALTDALKMRKRFNDSSM